MGEPPAVKKRKMAPSEVVPTTVTTYRAGGESRRSVECGDRYFARTGMEKIAGAATGLSNQTSRAFHFGPFRFLPEQQLLLEGDAPIRLSTRALEILLALVEKPGELIAKDELVSRAWPGTFVSENNLKVHVASLRKALGKAIGNQRYIATVSGRGYRFVSPVNVEAQLSSHRPGANKQNLPTSVTRVIGQDKVIEDLCARSESSRLLTIAGAGGIGKTTVALAVARRLLPAFEDGVWLVDLAPLTDPSLVSGAIAATLGLAVHSGNADAAVVAYLRDKRLLLVLDNCEHVVEVAAEVAERIVTAVPYVSILATSREPLRVRSEDVFRLPLLEVPPNSADLTAMAAREFTAVELFLERAARNGSAFVLNDDNAPLVGQICRSLDGIALAIELAATRVSSLGIETLSTELARRLQFLNQGDRSSPARQRTLYATLEWSYQLLTASEREVFQQLSLFAGVFSLEAAFAISVVGDRQRHEVIDALDSLVAKSLITYTNEVSPQYRLLETTRGFAREKLVNQDGFRGSVQRHAEYFRDDLKRATAELQITKSLEWLDLHSKKIDDVRAALNWALQAGDLEVLGISLVVAAIPLWSRMSLLDECRTWVERATSSPVLPEIDDRDKMQLYGALGATWFYTCGAGPQVKVALSKALRLAERVGNTSYRMRVLWKLAYYSIYIGKHTVAQELASRLTDIARAAGDPAGERDGDRTLAAALHYSGEHDRARELLERYVDDDIVLVEGPRLARFQLDHRVSLHCTLAHVLFVQGFPDQAVQSVEIAIDEARAIGHPLSLGSALVLAAIPIAIYRGDLLEAERLLAQLLDLVEKHGLLFWSAMTDCLQSTLLVLKGDEEAVPRLKRALEALRAVHFGARYPLFLGFLAYGLGAVGQREQGMDVIKTALRWSARHQELWCVPELVRINGLLISQANTSASRDAAEAEFVRAIELARKQGAMSWELKASNDLAKLWYEKGLTGKARELLRTVCARFSEGFETADMRAAQRLLKDLSFTRH